MPLAALVAAGPSAGGPRAPGGQAQAHRPYKNVASYLCSEAENDESIPSVRSSAQPEAEGMSDLDRGKGESTQLQNIDDDFKGGAEAPAPGLGLLEGTHKPKANQQLLFERLLVGSRVRSSETVAMMDENAYIAHFMTKNRIDENEAKKLWLADKADNQVCNESVRGAFCVAVPLNKTYYHELGVEVQREIEQQRLQLKSQEEIQSAKKHAHDLIRNTPVNPEFTALSTAQFALTSGIPDMRQQLSAAGQDAPTESGCVHIGNAQSAAADSNFGGNPSTLGPHNICLARQSMLIGKQEVLLSLSQSASLLVGLSRVLKRKRESKQFLEVDEGDRTSLNLDDLASRLDAKRTEVHKEVEILKRWFINGDPKVLTDSRRHGEHASQAAGCFQQEVDQLDQVAFV